MPSNAQIAVRSVVLGLIGNIFLAAIKFVAGFLGNSYALIADAIESTTDIFASILVLVGIKYAAKPADENHPYGHGRAEALLTFVVVAFLVLAATIIAYQSIINIQTPHATPKPYTLIVLVVIVAFKEVLYRFTKKKSKETHSTALHAEAWHHRSDAITSLLAMIGITVALIFGQGYEIADDIAALLASAFILYNAYTIFRPALGEIMDEHTHQELEEEVRKLSVEVEGVVDTEKCFIRKIGMEYQIDLHVIVDRNIPVYEGHEISHRLKDHLMSSLPNILNVLIHIEPTDE
ncbi:cation diffusion facilitator family transporter [Paracrocinitomix mangrovi]|uniref:cation diffusion facilitator family transporter n=1 Tax=Paracrocinitomix mangrovi TaxID=2862509 RepID=UPI001C8DF5D3|nr:cation diffusion facilitator family transporter [Paracrocinitomix mangrovi]UKN03748.1 cation diffusion facilitator family transporter [Paracrocinitomix mangrovi]